jgi:4-oxalocrotonate tautomerase
MPHLNVKLYTGRSDEDKAELARAITKNVITSLKCGDESVSVAIEDVPPGHWVMKVFKPEIAGKTDKLFKKPGYNPLQRSA